jgi:uncharacterized membrane protein (UPF0127 family)
MNTNTLDKKVLNKSLLILLIVVAIFVFLLLVAGTKGNPVADINTLSADFGKAVVNLNGKNLVASVADTDATRKQGLSGVHSLNDNEAMLFEFEESGDYGMWMKDMLIPIDMIWIDSLGRVVHIEERVNPKTYPKVFQPEGVSAKYVLELPEGYVERNDVKEGDLMIWSKIQK